MFYLLNLIEKKNVHPTLLQFHYKSTWQHKWFCIQNQKIPGEHYLCSSIVTCS